jgi:hypothetical protein
MTRQASVTIEGLDALQRDFTRLGKEVQKGLGQAVSATALDVDRDIKKRIKRGPKIQARKRPEPKPNASGISTRRGTRLRRRRACVEHLQHQEQHGITHGRQSPSICLLLGVRHGAHGPTPSMGSGC